MDSQQDFIEVNDQTQKKKKYIKGEGSGGVVKLAKNKDEKYFAIKKFNKFLLKKKRIIEKDKDGKQVFRNGLEDVMKEVGVLKRLDHPNIVRLEEVIDCEEKYARYGEIMGWNEETLKYSVQKDEKVEMEEEVLGLVFRDCIKGLHYLHSMNIIHRDIKPQNILVDDQGTTKLCDLGSCKELKEEGELLKGSSGTYHFMSPESVSGEFKEGFSGAQSDIWSLGVTFYCLVFGVLPFDSESLINLFSLIIEAPLPLSTQKRVISPHLAHLLQAMLIKDPTQRIHLPSLLQHPFLNLSLPPLSQSLNHLSLNPSLLNYLL